MFEQLLQASNNRPVREWDVGKKDKEEFDREDRDRNRNRDRKRSAERENRREKDLKKEDRPEKRRSISESPGIFLIRILIKIFL